MPLVSFAQTNAPRQLQFQVLDSASQQPIAGVRVRAWVRGELETDANGSCAFALPAPHTGAFSYRISLSKPGYVPEIVSWSSRQEDLMDEMPTNYIAHMAPAVGIGGIVKNDKGEPIPGARVVFSFPPVGGVEREKTLIGPHYHAERADDSGHWTNNEIPAEFQDLTLSVAAPDYVPADFGCASNENNPDLIVIPASNFLSGQAVMTLGHGIVLSGHVVDPAGHPVSGAVITKDYEWRNPATTQQTGDDGRFEIPNLRAGQTVLTVQSPDWAPQTVPVALSNGLPELTIALKPGQPLKGRVLDESNQPVAGARIELDREGREPLEFDWSADTADDGSFIWSNAPPGEHPYIVAAPGFHTRSIYAWETGGAVKTILLRHQKEGDGAEVSGQITDAATGAPVPKFTVQLTEYGPSGAPTAAIQDISAPDGRYRQPISADATAFALEIRADGYLPADSDRQSPGDGDQNDDFSLQRGVVRELTGRLIVKNYNDWIDWTNQQIALVAAVPQPAGLDSDDPATAERLMRNFLHTAAGRKWRQAQRPQPVLLDPRGFFKVENVAPGPHLLSAQILAAPQQGGALIATLNQAIDVPVAPASGAGAPIDLGTVEASARHDLAAGDNAPDFNVKSLDGPNLKLADFKGKYVLLDFWATWCGPCVGEVPNLKAAYDAFGQDPRLVMISLSLDQDPAAPKAFVRKNAVKWRQGFLGDWSHATLPNDYGVQGIPAIFLIGPDGKIIEHDLRGQAISDALKKALAAPN